MSVLSRCLMTGTSFTFAPDATFALEAMGVGERNWIGRHNQMSTRIDGRIMAKNLRQHLDLARYPGPCAQNYSRPSVSA